MSSHTPIARLHAIMTKKGITPDYKLLKNQTETYNNKFSMRLTCRVEPNGPAYRKDGFGSSIEDAKHQAALAFIKCYLENGNNNPCVTVNDTSVVESVHSNCAVNITTDKRNAVLQSLCIQYNLGKREYIDVEFAGPSHSKHFTIECRVSNFSTKGQGCTKAEAKLQATTKMIQRLMEERDIIDIYESPRLTIVKDSNEIVCLIDNLKGPQLLTPIAIYGRQKPIVKKKSDKVNIKSNNCNKVENVVKTGHDSGSTMKRIDFNNSQSKKVGSKIRSKSMNRSPNCITRSPTTQHAVNKIDATLESVEKQLYDEILDTLLYREVPQKKAVMILSHEYFVFINWGSRPKIFEGNSECTDASIKIASLAKLLMDIKMETNRK